MTFDTLQRIATPTVGPFYTEVSHVTGIATELEGSSAKQETAEHANGRFVIAVSVVETADVCGA